MRFSLRAGLAAGLITLGLVGGLVFSHTTRPTAATQAPEPVAPKPSPDEVAVHKTLEEFVNAFNAGDGKKAAATLTETAEYIDDDSNRIVGSAAVGELLSKFLTANAGAKIQITPSGARTIAGGVVVEDGESVITVPAKSTQSTRKFTVVYAKVDGGWKIASLREYPEEPEVVAIEDRLQDLAWFVGEWVDEGGDSLVTNSVRIAADKSHLIRDYSVKQEGDVLLKGMEWIGIDPLTGTIKSWSFDTGGGRSESTWTKNGDEWLVRSKGVTSDGDESGVTLIIKPISKDRIEIKAMHKVVGDTIEGDSTAIMVRKAPTPKK